MRWGCLLQPPQFLGRNLLCSRRMKASSGLPTNPMLSSSLTDVKLDVDSANIYPPDRPKSFTSQAKMTTSSLRKYPKTQRYVDRALHYVGTFGPKSAFSLRCKRYALLMDRAQNAPASSQSDGNELSEQSCAQLSERAADVALRDGGTPYLARPNMYFSVTPALVKPSAANSSQGPLRTAGVRSRWWVYLDINDLFD